MRSRLVALVGEEAAQRLTTISTFHAFGAQLLRTWGDKVGLNRNFAILNEQALPCCRRTLYPRWASRIEPHPRWISRVKSRLVSSDAPELVPDQEDDADMVPRYHAYHAGIGNSPNR